ncbi:hypothetical protein KEJ20_01570 [Candidatus Bathyarchaeota archaeon]|nr:hypothetical protein [Candidatus Bathyarchaeota archaeon]
MIANLINESLPNIIILLVSSIINLLILPTVKISLGNLPKNQLILKD